MCAEAKMYTYVSISCRHSRCYYVLLRLLAVTSLEFVPDWLQQTCIYRCPHFRLDATQDQALCGEPERFHLGRWSKFTRPPQNWPRVQYFFLSRTFIRIEPKRSHPQHDDRGLVSSKPRSDLSHSNMSVFSQPNIYPNKAKTESPSARWQRFCQWSVSFQNVCFYSAESLCEERNPTEWPSARRQRFRIVASLWLTATIWCLSNLPIRQACCTGPVFTWSNSELLGSGKNSP